MSTCNAPLDDLSSEVLGIIAKNLRQKDLNSLCLASKALHTPLNPLLWKNLTVRTKDEKSKGFDAGIFLQSYTYCPPRDHMRHVKNLIITAPIPQRPHSTCPHGPPDRTAYGLDPDAPNIVDRLSLSLVPFLQHLRDDQLRSFSWNVGMCLPCDVAPLFGPCGYLVTKQSSIESLSLITEGYCIWGMDERISLGLHNLKKLHHLSWKGLRATRYMKDLRSILECNADHMESLKLDVVNWDRANGAPDPWDLMEGGNCGWDYDVEDFVVKQRAAANFLAWKVFQLQPNIYRVVFPALTALSLSNISFEGAAADLACAFNGNMLMSLKLQNCRDCATFLLALVDSDQGIRLRLFHLSIDDRVPEEEPVNIFLEAFEGLEELGLLIKPGMATPDYWKSVMHHKSTLKRFVYHERHFDYQARLDRRWNEYNGFLDNPPFTEQVYGTEDNLEGSFSEFLAQSDLEYLALCDDLGSLKTRLQLMEPRSAIKLLHVRKSGADKEDEGYKHYVVGMDWETYCKEAAVRESMATRLRLSLDRSRARQVPGLGALAALARWAFGPDGLPNLQVLAYGDFSHNGRYIEDTFVFGRGECANSWRSSNHALPDPVFGYSLLQKEDKIDVMAQYGSFLGACPADSLIHVNRDMEDPADR